MGIVSNATEAVAGTLKEAVAAVTGDSTPVPGGATHSTIAADLDGSGPANIAPATTFSTSGAPVQIVPDVDPSHPAIDNDPRAGTTVNQNKIEMNDPLKTGAELAAEQLASKSKTS